MTSFTARISWSHATNFNNAARSRDAITQPTDRNAHRHTHLAADEQQTSRLMLIAETRRTFAFGVGAGAVGAAALATAYSYTHAYVTIPAAPRDIHDYKNNEISWRLLNTHALRALSLTLAACEAHCEWNGWPLRSVYAPLQKKKK
jgi:hypothetical protein